MGYLGSKQTKVSSELPDLLGPHLKAIFCGINPGLRAASLGHHFAGRGNRFWQVLHLAGFTHTQILPEFDRNILQYGYGITTAVQRPTARADELAQSEFFVAATELVKKLRNFAPRRIAFLGKPAFAAMYRRKNVNWGCKPDCVERTQAWVLPNPSGLNRGFTVADLVEAYRELHLSIEYG